MRVTGLDGRNYSWKMQGKMPSADDTRPRSSLHILARKLLREMFSLENVYEELYLPGSGGLYADFVIPTRKLMVEVHGEQHYKFSTYFHDSLLDFIEAKKRDIYKRDWAKANNLKLVELPYSEDADAWRERIRSAI
jgi:hypothetical protein